LEISISTRRAFDSFFSAKSTPKDSLLIASAAIPFEIK